MSNDLSTTSLGPLSYIRSITTALLLSTLLTTQLAHSESFLSCNQRPHSLESVASQKPSVVLAAGTSRRSTHLFTPATFTTGCSYSPTVTYTSLSADKGARAAAMHIAALVQLLQHRANPKQQEFKPLQVVITPDAAPNAFIRKGSELRVTSGMLKHLATPADAAFIVAHELAHLQLQHTHNTSTNEEIVADSLAVMMLERAEISACNAPHLLARILAENGRSESIARRRIAALLKRISATCAPKQKIS